MVRTRLDDKQWSRITAILEAKRGKRSRPLEFDRDFVEAVIWVARTGCPWRDLPREFGAWNTVYKRFSRWSDREIWKTLFDTLKQEGDLEEVFLDSTVVRAHQHAAGAPKKRGGKLWDALAEASRPKSTHA